MPHYAKVISEDEYQTKINADLKEITADIALENQNITIDDVFIHERVLDHVDTTGSRWGSVTSESIAKHADNECFDPLEDLQLTTRGDDIIRTIAYQTLHTALFQKLEQRISTLRQIQEIHTFLHRKRNNRMDEPSHPSTLLSEFNKWLVDKLDDEGTDLSFTYEDFNEQHIRGIEVLNTSNDDLIDYIYEWLSETRSRFPEAVK